MKFKSLIALSLFTSAVFFAANTSADGDAAVHGEHAGLAGEGVDFDLADVEGAGEAAADLDAGGQGDG